VVRVTSNDWIQVALYFAALALLAKPLGWYMARVYQGESCGGMDRVFGWLERGIYRVAGVNAFPLLKLDGFLIEQVFVNLLENASRYTPAGSEIQISASVTGEQAEILFAGGEAGITVFECGDLKVDLAARRVTVSSRDVHLTPNEYKLLTTLIKFAGKVLTHRQRLKEVWGPDQVHETHYLRVFMTNLRRKLEADPARPRYLLTEQGVGYRLASE